jgi:hypothetical protein
MTFTTGVADDDAEEAKADSDFEEVGNAKSDDSDGEQAQKQSAREDTLGKLQGTTGVSASKGMESASSSCTAISTTTTSTNTSLLRSSLKRQTIPADAIIVLKEERASIFHDFLKFVYPQ